MNRIRKKNRLFVLSILLGLNALTNELSAQNQFVFNKVWQALGIGDNVKPTPKIVLKATNTGTQINQATHTIFIDPGLLKVCESFGEKRNHALAFIFGQALHFYTKNQTFSLLPQAFRQPSYKSRFLKGDKKGIIYAYMAGYPMLDVYPQLLKKIYAHFGKTNAPILQYRLNNAKTLSKALQRLFLTFQTANYLLMSNEGLAAHECYQYILKEYNSKEIYNNAGANLLKMMMEDDTKQKFEYPIVLDFSTNLIHKSFKNNQKRITKTLQAKLLGYFQIALQKDQHYLPGYINIVNFYALTYNFSAAREYLTKAEQLAKEQKSLLLRQVQVLKALIAWQSNKRAEGEAILAAIANQGEDVKKDVAYYNLLVMKGANQATLKGIFKNQENAQVLATNEKIGGIDLRIPNPKEQAYKDGSAQAQAKLTLKQGIGIYADTLLNTANQKTALRIVFAHRGEVLYFLQTLPQYTGQTAVGKFALRSNFEQIQAKDKYGLPSSSLFTSKGEVFKVYRQRKIIFKVSKKGRLISWLLYSKAGEF